MFYIHLETNGLFRCLLGLSTLIADLFTCHVNYLAERFTITALKGISSQRLLLCYRFQALLFCAVWWPHKRPRKSLES